MDINARINWMPGMEVTAETFLGMAENWNYKYRLSLCVQLLATIGWDSCPSRSSTVTASL